MIKISASVALCLFAVNTLALTERKVIQRVLENHKLFESDEIDMLIQQERLQSKAINYYGWDLDLTAKYGLEKDSTDKDTNYTYTKSQYQIDREIGLELSTAFQNGATISTKFSRKLPIDDQQKYKKGVYDKDVNLTQRNNVLDTAINIPLFKNSDGGENKKLYDLATLDKKIEALNLLEYKENKVSDALISFIYLAIEMQRIKIHQQQLTALLQLQEIAVSQNDNLILQAKIQKIKISLSKSNVNLKSHILTLKSFIHFDENDLLAVDFNDKFRIILLKNNTEYLRQNNRDLKISELDIAKKQRYIDNYENKELADLDLNISHTQTQNQGNYSSYSYKHSNEYKVSLDLSYPLGGNHSNQYNLFKARLEKKKKTMDYKIDLEAKVLSINVLENALNIGNNTLNAYQSQINQGKNTKEMTRYLSHSGNIRFVIDELEEYYSTKFDYLDEAQAYHLNRIKYDQLSNRLLDKNLLAKNCNFCQKFN
jgi:hypothetical protein